MITEGVLDGVDAAFALHVSPNLPAGRLAIRPGPIMASSDSFHIRVDGAGGHPSMPHRATDPIAAACAIVQALHTFAAQEVSPFDPVSVVTCRIEAGSAHNVLPGTACVEGTIRTLNPANRQQAARAIKRIVGGLAAAHRCEAQVEVRPGYPVTINDADATDLLRRAVAGLPGLAPPHTLATPALGSEDFSYVLQGVPGALALLGVCPSDVPRLDDAPPCHSGRMRLAEEALWAGAVALAGTALRYLTDSRLPGREARSEGVQAPIPAGSPADLR
jgi:amidohydrolase